MKHNDRRFDVEKSEHIDTERTKQNIYWDCYQGYYSEEMIPENEEMPAFFLRWKSVFMKIFDLKMRKYAKIIRIDIESKRVVL